MKVMFDTNVFNHIEEGSIDLDLIPTGWEPIATHLQLDEIRKTPDSHAAKRERMLEIFLDIVELRVPTENVVLDVSRFGEANFGDENSLFEPIRRAMDQKKRKASNTVDALIAETCIKNRYLLVTNDSTLKSVAELFGCKVTDLAIAN